MIFYVSVNPEYAKDGYPVIRLQADGICHL